MNRRRKYDRQFKEEAVQLLIRSGKTLKEVAGDLGVERTCLGRWRKEQLKGCDEVGAEPMEAGQNSVELENENRRLRKELAEAVQQREILKKAIGIFSRDPDRYTAS